MINLNLVNLQTLVNLKDEAKKLFKCLSKAYIDTKNERYYKIYLKSYERLVRRSKLVDERIVKLGKQISLIDKAELQLIKKINSKSNAGRPKKENKKIPIGVKIPPYLNEWMKRQPESKATLIETALINYYQIPDFLKI